MLHLRKCLDDTPLTDTSAGLSAGQRQLLCIARLMLALPPMLILDEATSALDEDTEREVLIRLSSLSGRTCIAVTHRPAALALAQKRLHVRGKTIIES